jgi:uncharacterized protein YdgA (DUF945 family)
LNAVRAAALIRALGCSSIGLRHKFHYTIRDLDFFREGMIMNTEERLVRLENAFVNLTRLVESLDERLNTQLSWINSLGEAQANSDAKIAALADAQIKTEDALVKLAEAHTKLAESQAHADKRLDALIDIVREGRNGKS